MEEEGGVSSLTPPSSPSSYCLSLCLWFMITHEKAVEYVKAAKACVWRLVSKYGGAQQSTDACMNINMCYNCECVHVCEREGVCVYTHTHNLTCTYIHVYILYVYVYIFSRIYKYLCVQTCIHFHIYTFQCIYIQVYWSMYMCICVYRVSYSRKMYIKKNKHARMQCKISSLLVRR